jgi:mutator protein MutT
VTAQLAPGLQQRLHSVHAQYGGVLRLGDQAADGGFDDRCVQPGELGARFPEHPLGERGAAGNGRRAAADFVANLRHAAVFKARRQTQDIAASRIRDLHRDGGRSQLAHIARIFEMIEEGFAVHRRGLVFIMTTVVAAVIERDGCILIAQRKRTGQHPLKWEFPGGKAEAGETPEAAVARELEEELAIRARVDREIMRYEYQYPGRPPILLIFYRVTEFTGEPENLDFEQIAWVARASLGDYDFLKGDAEFISAYKG